MNNLYSGAGCQWWKHDGTAGQATFPSSGQGASTATHTASALYGARIVVIYAIHVTTGVGGDTFAIRTVTTAGSATALTGFSAVPCATTGVIYEFPGGLRVDSTHANISILTGDASVLTIFYRKIA